MRHSSCGVERGPGVYSGSLLNMNSVTFSTAAPGIPANIATESARQSVINFPSNTVLVSKVGW